MLEVKEGAEAAFREAFCRLKNGNPRVVDSKSPVSQNNVAKEAGRDPSALRKSRYPLLISEIQDWISKNRQPSEEKRVSDQLRLRVNTLQQRISQLEADRDLSQSLLLEAHDRIIELSRQNEILISSSPPANVHRLKV